MPAKKHDRDSITEQLRNLAQHLGKDTLTRQEIAKIVSPTTVSRYFGNLGNALEAAGLRKVQSYEHFKGRGPVLTDDNLFQSIFEVEQTLGHEPGFNEYISSHGSFSENPFRKRFGNWPEVLAHYRKWRSEAGGAVGEMASSTPRADSPRHASPQIRGNNDPTQLYGEPIDFRGLRHAPINEQGVVYMFGMVSRELGFYIEAIQQGFPDCEGKYLFNANRGHWAKARIEFEFRASNFTQHGHDATRCDFIICWLNDWPDCPIRVIELSQEILKLPSR